MHRDAPFQRFDHIGFTGFYLAMIVPQQSIYIRYAFYNICYDPAAYPPPSTWVSSLLSLILPSSRVLIMRFLSLVASATTSFL